MTKVLITGVAGFIGSNLADFLLDKGYEVIGIDNLSRGKLQNIEQTLKHKNFKFYPVDIRCKKISHYLNGVDTVFHLAALARIQPSIKEPVLYHENNVNGTFYFLNECVKAGVRRVVFSSSSSVYGIQTEMPEKETAHTNPLNPYAGGKLIDEIYMKVYANCYPIETVCLRYFNVYGPRQVLDGGYATVIGIFLKQKSEGKKLTIIGDGSKKRDFTWVKDACKANYLAMLSNKVGKGESINVGTSRNYLIKTVAEYVGGKTEYIQDRPHEAQETLADNSKAKELLGWEPETHLQEGIRILNDLDR
jgi:UDP-glucose 4-epimerase